MIVRLAQVGETFRVIVPMVNTAMTFPDGTLLRVTGHVADQPSQVLVEAISVPKTREITVLVPKGARITTVEQ